MLVRMSFVLSVLCLAGAVAAPKSRVQVVCPNDYLGSPIEHGRIDLVTAAARLRPGGAMVRVYVCSAGEMSNAAVKAAARLLPKKAESFVIARRGNDVAIVGRDRVGAMYGCFELAERLGIQGRGALKMVKPIVQSPAVEFRAVNPFLTLPYREDDTTWWFLQEDYWRGYLDQLARARINWVDLHGMYDIRVTNFPNIYPYFITSERFPEAGVEPAVAKRNLEMLRKVMRMARQRGIKFAMMSYSAGWDGPGLRKAPYPNTEENLAAYTREVVRKTIESCPDLAMIGFRIGESGKTEGFYRDSYIPAIKEAGRKVDLYTRTWGAKKSAILEIGKLFRGRFMIQIKYNGEQFGAPYIVQGGRMSGWRDYSYQDYFSYPKDYRVVFQLRANGTHRVFPWGNPILASRANVGSLLGGAVGISAEPIDAYYPKYDFRHREDSRNRWYRWQYERDWFWYQVWGRTAYDPGLANRDDVWLNMFAKRFGKAAPDLLSAMKWASKIVPDAYASYCLGPDHRQHAVELEWGGDVKRWATGQPLDTQNVASPSEYAAELVKGEFSGRATPITMSGYLEDEARMTRYHLDVARSHMTTPTPEFNDLATELTALSYLGDYYSHKLLAAAMFAVMQASANVNACEYADAERIREELTLARDAWNRLAAIGEEHYKPFVDRLRMGTEEYTWTNEGRKLDADFAALDKEIAAIEAVAKPVCSVSLWSRGDAEGPVVAEVACKQEFAAGRRSKQVTITARVSDPSGVARVLLKTKAFPSERGWVLTPMTPQAGFWTAKVTAASEGLLWCIEAVDRDGNGTTWPDFRRETPYKVVEPWESGVRDIETGAALGRIGELGPRIHEFSAMAAGREADALNSMGPRAKNTILDFVRDGVCLVLFGQDAPYRWHGGWLGGGIEYTDKDYDRLAVMRDHPILDGVPKVLTGFQIVNDALAGGDSTWVHLTEPSALAVRTLDKGCIIAMQVGTHKTSLDEPISKLIKNAVRFARRGSDKPVLVIDPGDGSVLSQLTALRVPCAQLGQELTAQSP